MNAKKRNAAITAILLADLAATETWPAAPSIFSNENVCRGSVYRGLEHSALPLKGLGPARGGICLKSAAGVETTARCGEWNFRREGAAAGSDVRQKDAGTVPARFFHFVRETQQ